MSRAIGLLVLLLQGPLGAGCVRDNLDFQPDMSPDLATSRVTVAPPPSGMVTVPGGVFTMGAPDNGDEASPNVTSRPMSTQTVATFYLDQTEVTVARYGECVSAGVCSAPATGSACNWMVPGRDQHPVNCVSWDQAVAYCQGAGKRLPTEIEWEYAARGPMGSPYPWGSDAPGNQLCWSQPAGTCPVKSYPLTLLGMPNPKGVADLAGNVWEWTADPAFCGYPLKSPTGGQMCDAVLRVFRGGAWGYSHASLVNAAFRNDDAPAVQYDILGFRCARTP